MDIKNLIAECTAYDFKVALNPLLGKIIFEDRRNGTSRSFEIGARSSEWSNDSITLEKVSVLCDGGNRL